VNILKSSLFKYINLSVFGKLYFLINISILFSAYSFFYNADYWGDEGHFAETISFFSDRTISEAVQDYPEVTPPLFYIVYSYWGKIFGNEIQTLRLLSVITGLFSFLFVYYIFKMTTENAKASFFASLAIILNPYLLGSHLFVYTDSLSYLFLLIIFYAVYLRSNFLLFIGAMGSLLIRQYNIFILVAVSGYAAINFLHIRNKLWIKPLIVSFISIIPLLYLFFLWNGLAPKSGLERWTTGNEAFNFRISNLVTYITFLAVYSLPFILFSVKSFWQFFKENRNLTLTVIVISFLYFFFPVTPSQVTLQMTGFETVGFAHRLIKVIFPIDFLEHLVLYFFFLLGLLALTFLFSGSIKKVMKKNVDYLVFLDLSVISFLLIMPFSYQVWEKYLIVILLPFAIRMLKHNNND